LMPRFDTCVHCIVLKDAGPGIEPHPELSNPRPVAMGTSYHCNGCGTQWTYHPENGWTSGTALTARFDGSMNTRVTPSLNNVGYLRLWYWDGRGKTLEGVATAAWQKQMGGDPEAIAMKLNGIPGYKDAFQKAMGGPATGDSIAKALATFMRTIKSEDSPWDRYEQGDKSASDNGRGPVR